jgi:protein-disulfide isomerase
MESRGTSCCKLGVAISVLALGVAITAYLCPKKETAVQDTTLDERVRSTVIDVIKQNPQMLMDAVGEGIARQRVEAAKQLSNDVLAQKAELMKQGIRLGKIDSKVLIICFFDPLCKHCVDFQKSVMKLIEAKKDVEFVLLPVAVLGDDSALFCRVYYALHEKAPDKILKFVKAVVEAETMDKKAIEDALKKVGLESKDIEANLQNGSKKLEENGTLAERLKIPVVPAIFVLKGNDVQMLQATGVEQVLQAIDGSANPPSGGGGEAEAADGPPVKESPAPQPAG